MKSLWIPLALSGLVCWAPPAFSQKENPKIEPLFQLQLWSSYTMGQEVFNDEDGKYEPVDDRFNVLLRRGRFGLRGQPFEFLHFTAIAAFDGVGKDLHSAMIGQSNNLSSPRIFLWDAFVQWKILKNSEALYLTGGYFRPQLSRESITSAWAVNSMEKAMSQSYIRNHLVGYGHGRAAGLNLGGLFFQKTGKCGLGYNLGVFNPIYQVQASNSTGNNFAPLLVGRAMLWLGDPEQGEYGISYQINHFGKRKGLSLAGGGAWQGETDKFTRSAAASADALFNWGPLNLDAEWNGMWRAGSRFVGSTGDEHLRYFTAFSQTWHARAGYNIPFAKQYFLEPVFMVMHFSGAKDGLEQGDAYAAGTSLGTETTYDLGINWYLRENKLRVLLHYTWHNPPGYYDGFQGNSYYFEPELGAIRRGNWLGLGLNAMF